MASQLNFHRKMPSEIKRIEIIPPVETMNRYQNAVVDYDGTRTYIVWKTTSGATKAEINEKKLGISNLYVSGAEEGIWKKVVDSNHILMAYSSMMKMLNTSRGMNWFITALNNAKQKWHASRVCTA